MHVFNFDKRVMSRTAVTLKFKMRWFPVEDAIALERCKQIQI